MTHKTLGGDLRKVAQLLVVAVTLLASLSLGQGVASAHAELTSSTPAEGSTVQAGLTEITLGFDDQLDVDQSTAEVSGPNGTLSGVTAAIDRTDRGRMTVKTAPLTAGTYQVKWTVVAANDNNIAVGTLSFTVASSGTGSTGGTGSTAGGSTTGGSTGSTGSTGTGTGTGSTSGGPSTLPTTGIGAAEGMSLLLMAAGFGVLALGMLMRRAAGKQQ